MEFILKNPTLLLGVVVLFAILVALCILWLLPALIKRGVDVSGTIEKADLAISTLDSLTDTIKALFPNTPGLDMVDKILVYAQKAVDSAEQLYKTSQIPEEQRKAEATQLVYICLQAAGVDVTEDMKKIIDGAIEAAVYALPKTHSAEINHLIDRIVGREAVVIDDGDQIMLADLERQESELLTEEDFAPYREPYRLLVGGFSFLPISTFFGFFIVCECPGWGCNRKIAVAHCLTEFFITHIPGGYHCFAGFFQFFRCPAAAHSDFPVHSLASAHSSTGRGILPKSRRASSMPQSGQT